MKLLPIILLVLSGLGGGDALAAQTNAGPESAPFPPAVAPRGPTSITDAENAAMRWRAAKTRQAAAAATNAAPVLPAKPIVNAATQQTLDTLARRGLRSDPSSAAAELHRLQMEAMQRRYWAASPKERAKMQPMPPIDRNSPRERMRTKTALKAESAPLKSPRR